MKFMLARGSHHAAFLVVILEEEVKWIGAAASAFELPHPVLDDHVGLVAKLIVVHDVTLVTGVLPHKIFRVCWALFLGRRRLHPLSKYPLRGCTFFPTCVLFKA
jgi:hypothetical protein